VPTYDNVFYFYVNCEACSDVEEVLSKLKKMGLKIGLVSTAYEEEIAVIFGKVNLEKGLFDVIVGADTEKREASSRCFQIRS